MRDLNKAADIEGGSPMNRAERQDWLEKRISMLEKVVRDVGKSTDDTVDHVINDLSMVAQKIQNLSDSKVSRETFEALPDFD